jgi:nicotinamide-nucleotide amidase
MRITLISIGSELLKGQIVNTNVCFLSRHLAQEGYTPQQHLTVSDEKDSLKKSLQAALNDADLVLTTGGLGPTLDDVTRHVVADLLQCGFRKDLAVERDLKQRYPHNYFAVEDQAVVPEKAHLFPNRVGSAPGLLFSEKGKWLIMLPGVPQEMTSLFLEQVLPWLRQTFPRQKKEQKLLHFCLLYESLIDPTVRELSAAYPTVEVGIYPHYGSVSISLLGTNEVAPFEQALLSRFGTYSYESPSGSIAEALIECCRRQNKKIAFAESCTGGHLAAAITAVPGASDVFLGSLVTYSNALKTSLLHVPEETLRRQGAVSSETVQAMLDGLFACTDADYGIAVSGIAGPLGGTPEKPVGTLFAALGERKKSQVGKFQLPGDRSKVIALSTHYLLAALFRSIMHKAPPFPFP